MNRSLSAPIKKDLAKKMVFLTGPRQVGKTWLAKALMDHFRHPQYLNQRQFFMSPLVLDQIRTIDKTRLIKNIGAIDEETMFKATSALQSLFAT